MIRGPAIRSAIASASSGLHRDRQRLRDLLTIRIRGLHGKRRVAWNGTPPAVWNAGILWN